MSINVIDVMLLNVKCNVNVRLLKSIIIDVILLNVILLMSINVILSKSIALNVILMQYC